MVTSEELLIALDNEVKDPEVPVISVVELGIVRSVEVSRNLSAKVVIAPTYSGCPALKVIEDRIRECLQERGANEVEIVIQNSPPWTTDWISAEGRKKLKEYGIAPPKSGAASDELVQINPLKGEVIACPFCESEATEQRSFFGSTACKALYFCNSCDQPFEYFKKF